MPVEMNDKATKIQANVRPLVKNIAVTTTPLLQDIGVQLSSNIIYAFSPTAYVQQLPSGNYLVSITDKNGTTTAQIPRVNDEYIAQIINEYFSSRSVISDFLEEYNNEEESRAQIQNLILNAVSSLNEQITSLTNLVNRLQNEKVSFQIDSKENWDSQTLLVSEKDTVYFYTNYKTKTLGNDTVQNIPGIKIGDGSAYLIDLPFIGQNPDFEQHIRNTVIHITSQERTTWNDKVSCEVAQNDNQNLMFFY